MQSDFLHGCVQLPATVSFRGRTPMIHGQMFEEMETGESAFSMETVVQNGQKSNGCNCKEMHFKIITEFYILKKNKKNSSR